MIMERIAYHELPQELYQMMRQVEAYLHQSGLDLRLLDLMRYRVSQINHCAYCLDMHYKEAIAHGEEPIRLYSLSAWEEAPYYSDKEKLVFRFAETLTLLPENHVDDALYAALEQHFSKQEIANLTLAVAQINSWNRLVQCFRPTPGKYVVQDSAVHQEG
jgi:AhpD family alkylhydroperoxidase